MPDRPTTWEDAQPGSCDPWSSRDAGGRQWLGGLVQTGVVLAVFLAPAVVGLLAHRPGPLPLAVTLAAVATLTMLFAGLVAVRGGADRPVRWLELAGLVAVAVGLATQGTSWVPALGPAALVIGLRSPAAVTGALVTALSGLGGVLGWLHSNDPTTAVTMLLVPATMGGFGYLGQRNTLMSARLRASERELAGLAVAEERLRIARELHDLLGHSLSVIALKAELAGNLLTADTHRAGREIGEVAAVARRSLSEVREAVTGYRTPTLAAELATARQSIDTAGIACEMDLPESYPLPTEVDALLAWTVREGTTNLIRHSRASTCTLRVHTDDHMAAVEIIDDGVGPDDSGGDRSAGGNGLTGLAERASRLGGRLHAGAGAAHGFRLRVRVPLTRSP